MGKIPECVVIGMQIVGIDWSTRGDIYKIMDLCAYETLEDKEKSVKVVRGIYITHLRYVQTPSLNAYLL